MPIGHEGAEHETDREQPSTEGARAGHDPRDIAAVLTLSLLLAAVLGTGLLAYFLT
jgi:hypothetical protein